MQTKPCQFKCNQLLNSMHGKYSNTILSEKESLGVHERVLMRCVLVVVCVCRCTLYSLLCLLADRCGVRVSRMWLSRMFRRWRWSFKKISHKHVRKFAMVINIRNVPMHNIKYIDEASFDSRGHYTRLPRIACHKSLCASLPTHLFVSSHSHPPLSPLHPPLHS